MKSSDYVRGFVMLIAAAVALWKGWQIHHGNRAILALVLAVLALGMAVWHFTRRTPRPRA